MNEILLRSQRLQKDMTLENLFGIIEWRDLVLLVEGIIEKPDSRRQHLESLKKLRK